MPTLVRASIAAAALVIVATSTAMTGEPGQPFVIEEASVVQVEATFGRGELTCVELVGFYLERLAALEAPGEPGPTLDAIRLVNPNALAQARALDALGIPDRGARPLFCVPMLVKDNYDTIDMPTTAGSKALEGSQPGANAFVLDRLLAAGAILIAKTNMAEFALFGSSINGWTGSVGSAYDLGRDAGGSSSGSAAGLAVNGALVALGTDTCGSNRIPAANNALVGFRGTLGLISRTGLVPVSALRDAPGPMARSVADLAAMLDIMAAVDPNDPTTVVTDREQPDTYLEGLDAGGLEGKRIGVLTMLGEEATFGDDADNAAAMAGAIADLRAAGAIVVDGLQLGEFTPLNTTPFEAPGLLDAYLRSIPDPVIADFADLAQSDLTLPASHELLQAVTGLSTDNADYISALEARVAMRALATGLLEQYQLDALVFPTVRSAAPMRGEDSQASNCELGASTGMPSVVVPMGWTADANPLPLSIEFFGRAWDEASLLGLAYAYEQATHHRVAPK